jgi:hypothetical protein
MTESRDAIVDRASRGTGVTPQSHMPWCSIERQTLLELLGASVEIRDQLARIAAALSETQKETIP